METTHADSPAVRPLHSHARQATEHAHQLRTRAYAARAATILSRDEELRLARAARGGDEQAFARLISAHLPLVHAIAWQFRRHGLPLEDLTSEALLGLVKGARCFDPERGVRLAAYAALWIRAYVRRYTLDNRRLVRGPSSRNARKVLAGLRRAEHDLTQTQHERPDAETLAQVLGVKARDVEDIRAILSVRDVPCGVAIDGRSFDPPSHAPSPEALAAEAGERQLAAELVRRALTRLDGGLRDVIEQRCLSQQPPSLTELGKQLGVSHEAVRQMELRAKSQLREVIAGTMVARGFEDEELCGTRLDRALT